MLMRLLMRALRDETDRLYENNVRVDTIGDTASLPKEVRHELTDAIEKTRNNTGLRLLLALSYSGRWDLTQAVTALAVEVRRGNLQPEEITDSVLAEFLSTRGFPDPDLLIRTSGEFRISNFLLWQLAYSEIYISPVFWPAFRRMELYAAISDYQRSERRFGMVSEQLPAQKTSGSPATLIKPASGH
jgi:undecaprenyl diphosphate synthase